MGRYLNKSWKRVLLLCLSFCDVRTVNLLSKITAWKALMCLFTPGLDMHFLVGELFSSDY